MQQSHGLPSRRRQRQAMGYETERVQQNFTSLEVGFVTVIGGNRTADSLGAKERIRR